MLCAAFPLPGLAFLRRHPKKEDDRRFASMRRAKGKAPKAFTGLDTKTCGQRLQAHDTELSAQPKVHSSIAEAAVPGDVSSALERMSRFHPEADSRGSRTHDRRTHKGLQRKKCRNVFQTVLLQKFKRNLLL